MATDAEAAAVRERLRQAFAVATAVVHDNHDMAAQIICQTENAEKLAGSIATVVHVLNLAWAESQGLDDAGTLAQWERFCLDWGAEL